MFFFVWCINIYSNIFTNIYVHINIIICLYVYTLIYTDRYLTVYIYIWICKFRPVGSVISHIWVCHVTHMNESCHTLNESLHEYEYREARGCRTAPAKMRGTALQDTWDQFEWLNVLEHSALVAQMHELETLQAELQRQHSANVGVVRTLRACLNGAPLLHTCSRSSVIWVTSHLECVMSQRCALTPYLVTPYHASVIWNPSLLHRH